MESQEVKAFPLPQIRNAVLFLVDREVQIRQRPPDPLQRSLRLLPVAAEEYHVVRISDLNGWSGPLLGPAPVELVEVDVGQQGRNGASHAKDNLVVGAGRWKQESNA